MTTTTPKTKPDEHGGEDADATYDDEGVESNDDEDEEGANAAQHKTRNAKTNTTTNA